MDSEKIVEVPLEKGVPEEHDYVFYGESDEIVKLFVTVYLFISLELWQEIYI